MKTLIIYNECDYGISYFIVDGDYSRFNNSIINCVNGNGFEDEFVAWFYDSEGKKNFETSTDISLIENKEWDKIALVTWLP